jgi:hypothetical protein
MMFRNWRRGFWARRGISSIENDGEYLLIQKRDDTGRVIKASWLDPARVTPEKQPDGTIHYRYSGDQ